MQNRLQEIRKAYGISQEKCSSDTGIPLRTLKRYEKGDHSIGNVAYLRILAEYYNVQIEELFVDTPKLSD